MLEYEYYPKEVENKYLRYQLEPSLP
jgi:hypothetical protein